jgi:uncharacterized membrane protein
LPAGESGNSLGVSWAPSAFRAGLLAGIGLAGTLDLVVLHELLGWHHFYDRGTERVGQISDGLFHLATTACLALGVLGLARSARNPASGRAMRPSAARRGWGGVLIGAGGFNLYDGIVQHKLLELHQVRPAAPDQLPYDIVFTGIAALVFLAGVAMLSPARRSRR